MNPTKLFVDRINAENPHTLTNTHTWAYTIKYIHNFAAPSPHNSQLLPPFYCF